MAKVDQVANGDSGSKARSNWNDALKSIDVDSTMTGDGTSGSPAGVDTAYLTTFVQNLIDATMATDFLLDVAQGDVTGHSSVNKFGRTTNADSGVDTDIWDGANATDVVNVWVAPTAARIHQIASSSASDDGSPGGVGARTLRIWGLQTWTSNETSEDITLNGTSNVATANSYVIIHRMAVLTKGATNVNVGKITATADTDATVTAYILAGEGQTQMAIYGIPQGNTAYLTGYYASNNGSVNADVDIELLFNPEPDTELTNFVIKHTQAIRSGGASYLQHFFKPYAKFTGPGILKLRCNADVNNTDVSGGFDIILVDESEIT